MSKLEFTVKYIADAIIQVKIERFGETFVSIDELLIIKELIELRLKEKGYDVSFGNLIFSSQFHVDNVITKVDDHICEEEIGDEQVRKIIYDKEFIYYCLCQMLINRLNNSMEHTCANCITMCTGLFCQSHSKPNDCTKWTHNFVEDCINNISDSERSLIEESQSQQNPLKKLSYNEQ